MRMDKLYKSKQPGTTLCTRTAVQEYRELLHVERGHVQPDPGGLGGGQKDWRDLWGVRGGERKGASLLLSRRGG